MKKLFLIALQLLLVLAGNALFVFLLVEPQLEGRNAQATLFETYCTDPFLAFIYLASLPLFWGLFQAFKLLGFAGQETIYSPESVQAARTLKFCARAFLMVVAFSLFFMIFADPEDRPAGLFMRLLVGVPATLVAWGTTLLQRALQNGLNSQTGSISTVGQVG